MQCLHGYFFVDFSRLLGAIQPGVLTLPDCRNLLASAREYKDGLRAAEIARLTWDRIDLAEGTITLDGSMAKTRQRRIVRLPGNAVAWLLPFAVKRKRLEPAAFQVHFGRVKKAAGFNGKEGTNRKEAEQKLRP